MNDTQSELAGTASPASAFRFPLLYSLALIFALVALDAWAWTQLPGNVRIPIHWGAAGQVDGWSGKGALFLFPGLLIFDTLLLFGLPYIDPRKANLMRSSKAYSALWIALNTFMAGCGVAVVAGALGRPGIMGRFIPIGIGLLFGVIGNYLGKVRSNFFFGVRTPWTLSSELSWNKTHRLAGWIFVAFGMLMIAGSIFQLDAKTFEPVTLGFVAALLLVLLPYSYFVWKSDPNRAEAEMRSQPAPELKPQTETMAGSVSPAAAAGTEHAGARTAWLVNPFVRLSGSKALLLGLAAICLASWIVWLAVGFMGARAPVAPTDSEKAVQSEAEAWLGVADRGDYGECWKEASTAFQAAVTPANWTSAMERYRKPLGATAVRTLIMINSTKKLPDAPPGEYVVMQFETVFNGKSSGIETVTFSREKDGRWKASGYFIK